MIAEIVAVGSELLGAGKLDTNSLYLTDQLARLGIRVVGKAVVGDDRDRLTEILSAAMCRCDLVITTGGLGPTLDDLTREAAANATGRQLVLDDAILVELKERYAQRGIRFMENSERQAMVLQGAEPIPNGPGSAPGMWLEKDGTILVLLPGVPREMRFMMEQYVVPKLKKHGRLPERISRSLNLVGIPESVVDQRVRGLDFAAHGVDYTILASLRRVQITLSSTSASDVNRLAAAVRAEFGDAIYGEGDGFIEEAVLAQLAAAGCTLALAESCTGGLAAKFLTDVPGSSRSFLGAVVAYDNRVKEELLGVEADVLGRFGAVSAQCAARMARGVRRSLGADIGASVTGIAGPGHDGDKPVGLVYMAVTDAHGTVVRRHRFQGDREMIRIQSATRMLDLVRRRLTEARR